MIHSALGIEIPLVMRHDDLRNLVFREWDVLAPTYLADSTFNNADPIKSPSVNKNNANHLITHSRFGLRSQL